MSPVVAHNERLELSFVPKPWDFAEARRAEIDRYFSELQHRLPDVWNGRVLLLHRQSVVDRVFSGAYLETDYASFAAWQHWGYPEASVRNCFGAAAIVTSDNALLLGVMADHTANARRIYFPCGTPEPNDIVGSRVDLDLSMRRELEEETGLRGNEFETTPGWTTVMDGALIAQIKVLRGREPAEVLRARILDALERQQKPELSDIRIARGPNDVDPAMPAFVTAFLTNYWR